MSRSRFTTRQMATAGIIAAIYAGLTLLLPIPQYGAVQLRVAEAMTVLPFLFPGRPRPGCRLLPRQPPWLPLCDGLGVRHPGHPFGGAVDLPAKNRYLAPSPR